jgi:hypothetical protein
MKNVNVDVVEDVSNSIWSLPKGKDAGSVMREVCCVLFHPPPHPTPTPPLTIAAPVFPLGSTLWGLPPAPALARGGREISRLCIAARGLWGVPDRVVGPRADPCAC